MNLIESLVSAEFIRAFAWTLLHSLWQGGLIALIAAGLMMILRKHRPGVRYVILYILILLLPVFFVGTFLMIYNPANTGIHAITPMHGPIWQAESSLAGNLQAIPVNEIPHAWYAYLVNLFENQAKWLVLLWFTGFLVFLVRFSGSFLYVYRLKNHHLRPVDGHWKADLLNLSDKMGMHRTVKLAESALAHIPMTIGYLKPVILLPLGTLSGVPPQQMDAILLHELAHILRKDYLLNILQSVIELLFFYHPVTWWLSGLIRQEREHICDDLAVAVNQDHINYIKALTTMEELNSKSPLLASAMMGSKKKLLIRVKRLLSPVKLSRGVNEGIIAFVLLIGLVFALSLNALSHIPNAYDLTGRESGEKVYSIVAPALPDTLVARSRDGKVVISVYTDSTSQLQQEQLNRMADQMDRQTKQPGIAREEYNIQVRKFDDDKDQLENERKIVIIKRSDTTSSGKDSVVVIPGLPDMDSLDKLSFSFSCDSIDTVLFMGPEGNLLLNNKDWELTSKELQEEMNDLGIDLERQQRDAERQQRDEERHQRDEERHQRDEERMDRDQHGDILEPQPDPFFYSVPPIPPEAHGWNDHNRGPGIAPSEKIIRQELIDDGLASPKKKYVIDLDSKGMYINGEKQSKEAYRKYKHLVESLDLANLKEQDTYRLLF